MNLPTRFRGLRAVGILLSVLLIGGMVGAVGITPASAATPSDGAQFFPDDNGPGNSSGSTQAANAISVVSDRADGTDSTAHLTTVLDPTGVANEWFVCDAFDADPTDNTSKCGSIGVDTSGVIPGGAADSDAAFDLFWDIPQTVHYNDGTTVNIDDQTKTIESWGCTSASQRTPTNCTVVDDDSVDIDDTADDTSAADKTTAGEITSPANGANVSRDGFRANATTSDDVVEVHFCLDETADSGDDWGAPNDCDTELTDTTPDTTSGGASTWHVDFSAGDVPANSEMGLSIFESSFVNGGTSGSDLCDGGTDCELDSHYLNSTRGVQNGDTAFVNFPNATTAGNVCGDTTTGSSTPNSNTVTNVAGDDEEVEGCVKDSSGAYVTDELDWAMQVTPQDTNDTTDNERCFTGGGGFDGTRVDSEKNLCFESVMGEIGDGDTSDQQVTFFTAGSYTVTYCVDVNNNGACDSGELSATGTKTVKANEDDIRDLIDSTSHVSANGGKCATSDTNVQAAPGSSVQVTECVTDEFGNPIAGAAVSWEVDPNSQPHSGSYTATDNTTDTQGHANATFAGGDPNTQAFLDSCAQTGNGSPPPGDNACSNNAVIVNWTGQQGGTKANTSLSLFKAGPKKLKGVLSTSNENVCRVGGKVIKLLKGGNLVDVANTGAGGVYTFTRPKAPKKHNFQTKFAGSSRCKKSASPVKHFKNK